MKYRTSKLSKACDISPKVRQAVYERDNGICVICREKQGLPNMHYIPRAQLGLGIEQNIVCGCLKCHAEYDNGKYRKHHGEVIKTYLQSKYENWNEEDLIYHKYQIKEQQYV
jgi:5-methylcytosine-specific restriction endonuclease McrA